MNTVLGFRKVFRAMQNNPATDARAIERVLLKEEAERLSIIVNHDFFSPLPAEMLIQDFSQFAPQNRSPGNLMKIFPTVELIVSCDFLWDGELTPLFTVHILCGLCKSVERPIGQSDILFPAMHLVGAIFQQPGEPNSNNSIIAYRLIRIP